MEKDFTSCTTVDFLLRRVYCYKHMHIPNKLPYKKGNKLTCNSTSSKKEGRGAQGEYKKEEERKGKSRKREGARREEETGKQQQQKTRNLISKFELLACKSDQVSLIELATPEPGPFVVG